MPSFRTRLFCFTNFNLLFNYQNVLDTTSAVYIAYGEEVCPSTKKPHHQGFIYYESARACKWNGKYYFSRNVGKDLGNCHNEGCKGNLDQNTDYCTKDTDGTLIEFGVRPKQGFRTDLEAIKENILTQKISVDEICIENPIIYHMYARTLNKLEDIALRKKCRNWMTKGLWLWGETGVGKSHKAFEGFTPDTHYVYPNDGGWWDGYTGQEIVIFNEFRGEIPFRELLDLCDKWPKQVRRRCREPVPFLAKKIIVTSSQEPDDVYYNVCDDVDSIAQLRRRFDVVKLTQKWSEGNTN